ncbi:hypothetical protein TrRE_jg4676 [Triparma retinervis]|uniref:Inosine triphosphate pyrophosphatase n=1 Tax=Triparma retinervis TaxID=2557542 RepID=A0A9W7A9J2_9STRA|nr:hypothetical protein TrRE_jg4676 [Triparma retinervis]
MVLLLLLLLLLPASALKVNFCTGNAMKIREMKSILETHSNPPLIELSHLKVDLPEIQAEDAAVIPKHKATLGAQLASGACVCEDTSLCLHALGGMPGPFIKFFQKSLGNKGLWDVLDAYPVKTATAVCTLAFVPAVHADPIVFEGVVEGTLVNPEDPKWKFHEGRQDEVGRPVVFYS